MLLKTTQLYQDLSNGSMRRKQRHAKLQLLQLLAGSPANMTQQTTNLQLASHDTESRPTSDPEHDVTTNSYPAFTVC
jgi:hypothetical protein